MLYITWKHVVCSLVSIYLDSPQPAIQWKKKNNSLKLYLDYWFTDMLNFDFLEKSLGIVSPPHLVYLSCYILFTGKILESGYLYFLRYWVICVLQSFPLQTVTSSILKLTVLLSTWVKLQDQKLKYIVNGKSFEREIKSVFSSFLKGFQFPKIALDMRVRVLVLLVSDSQHFQSDISYSSRQQPRNPFWLMMASNC